MGRRWSSSSARSPNIYRSGPVLKARRRHVLSNEVGAAPTLLLGAAGTGNHHHPGAGRGYRPRDFSYCRTLPAGLKVEL